jgi:hypothetical protein
VNQFDDVQPRYLWQTDNGNVWRGDSENKAMEFFRSMKKVDLTFAKLYDIHSNRLVRDISLTGMFTDSDEGATFTPFKGAANLDHEMEAYD